MGSNNQLFELDAWITELKATGQIDDAEATSLKTIIGKDKVLAKVKDQFQLRPATQAYMDKLRKEHADRMAQEDAFHEDVANFKKGAEAKLQKAIQQRTQLEAQIRALAEQNDADPEKDWGFDFSGSTPARDPLLDRRPGASGGKNGGGDGEPPSDKRLDELTNDIRQSPRFAAALADIQAEHQELFGKPLRGLSTRTLQDGTVVLGLVDRALKEKKSIRQIWEEDNKVADRRAEIDKKNKEAHDKEVGDAAVTRYVSEHAVDPLNTPTRTRNEAGSPILNTFNVGKKASEQKPEERSVGAALDAFHSGKYREQAKRG